ncbi:MAG: nicotinate-nicotinamide nucleotide adenylyltransferase, partial [Anaerolineales bacterium]
MLELCLANNPDFVISRLDIDRPGPHYAVDTVKLLAEDQPDAIVVYIMGGDSLKNLPTWHKPKNFVEVCHELGVMRRPRDMIDLDSLEKVLPSIKNKVRFMDAPLLGISSEQIRIRVAAKRPYRYYVTPLVFQYIEDHQLYR